jgi:N-methylhydantoinase A
MTVRTIRVGADIGGTFTDITFLVDNQNIHVMKCPSTPDDYSRGIVDGVLALLARIRAEPGDIEEVVHATTVATNAILEGKGARTALLTTEGFGDVVEIGRLRMPELYNLNYEKPLPLVPRRRRYEIAERLSADGSVVRDLDEAAVESAAEAIRRDGAAAVAVSYLHAYANPAHESRTKKILERILGRDVFVSCSSDVLPEIREYERTSTVVVNAYLGPVVASYLQALQERLRAAGVTAPLQIMQSGGGVMSAASAAAKPACIIESGPSAGVIASARIGGLAGYRDLITVDMGGTTAKAAIIENGEPARTTEYEVGAGINLSSRLIKGGGHAVKLPFIDVSEIGAGGGSIVRVDAGGLIQVGPDSAGAVPGPACYAAGGTRPTLTDALVVLGYINPHAIAGGTVPLDASLSRRAIEEQVCGPTGLGLLEAAHGVFSIAAATMMRAVKAVSTYRGRDPRDFVLFAFGGNGPVISTEIARLLEMRRVVVPRHPGVFSALGLLFSATEQEELQTCFAPLADVVSGELGTRIATLERRVRDALVAEGYNADDIVADHKADLRYAGQAYELTVPVVDGPDGRPDLAALAGAFHREHERTYGHASTDAPVEVVNIRVTGRVQSQSERLYRPVPPERDPGTPASTRQAWFGPGHGLQTVPVLDRGALADGEITGPAVIEEYDATCVVPPGWSAGLDTAGNIVLTQSGEH